MRPDVQNQPTARKRAAKRRPFVFNRNDICYGAVGALFTAVAMLENLEFSAVPSWLAPTMMASAMRAAIRPYSMAVAPDSSFTKRAMRLDIRELLLHVLQHFRQLLFRLIGCCKSREKPFQSA